MWSIVDSEVELVASLILGRRDRSGMLLTAYSERMQRVASSTEIELVWYESDSNIIGLLRSNVDCVCDHAA